MPPKEHLKIPGRHGVWGGGAPAPGEQRPGCRSASHRARGGPAPFRRPFGTSATLRLGNAAGRKRKRGARARDSIFALMTGLGKKTTAI